MTIRKLFRKFIVSMAKPIPGRTPFWPIVLGTVGAGVAWTYLPYIFLQAFKQLPILSVALQHLPLGPYLPYILSYVAPTLFTYICLMPICKGIQLLDPDEFDQYNDDD